MDYRINHFLPGLILSLFLCLIFNIGQAREADTEELVITNSEGQSISYTIEVARTSTQMTRGLMFRDNMPEDRGMLFIYQPERVASMWMKNTILSLDMLFIDANGVIVTIAENTTPYSLDAISSSQPVRAVLELNAGQVSQHGFKTGDIVIHTSFDNN